MISSLSWEKLETSGGSRLGVNEERRNEEKERKKE
jgi:hypothetical protein